MIFYFSGTGNSQMVAQMIAKNLQDKMVPMVKVINSGERLHYTLQENEHLIFVFPVYAWAPPQIVLEFIQRLTIEVLDNQPLSVIVTCAKTQGNTINVIKKALKKKGLKLTSAYLLKMPNNYNIIGYVDSPSIIRNKLSKSKVQVEEIIEHLMGHSKGEISIDQERCAILKTAFGGFLLNQFATNTKLFAANDDCIRCQVCEKICPSRCITVIEKPIWRDKCHHCLACLHYCPKSAIQYGNHMGKKARYTNPIIPWYELNQEKDFTKDDHYVLD